MVKLSLGGQDGAFEAKALELLRVIEAFRDNLDDVRREIFANLFTRRTGENMDIYGHISPVVEQLIKCCQVLTSSYISRPASKNLKMLSGNEQL